MILTKETMVHIAAVTAITGIIFGIILSSGAYDLDEIKIQVTSKAKLSEDVIFLTSTVNNIGDYNIEDVLVRVPLCGYSHTYNEDLDILQSMNFLDIIPITQCSHPPARGDELIVQFNAMALVDDEETRIVDIMTVRLD